MDAGSNLQSVGRELVQDSRRGDFSAARGAVVEMLPYIVQASLRMSTRAISNWLDERHNIYISAATIAKALREPEKYWALFLDRIYGSALAFESAVGVPMEEFLFNRQKFEELVEHGLKKRPVSASSATAQIRAALNYDKARRTLATDWFSMEDAIISTCKEPVLAEIRARRLLPAIASLKARVARKKLRIKAA